MVDADTTAPQRAVGHHGPVVALDPGVDTVLDLVADQMRRRPDAPALRQGPDRITYQELDLLADQIAGVLREEFDVGTEDVVLIAAEAGIAFCAVLLGTLSAGAAYLPVDTTYPPHRIEHIMAASGATLRVLSDARTAGTGERTVLLDDLVAAARQRKHALSPRPSPAATDAAYVIFTSGSTGRPKGIVQTHRCLVNFVSWQVNAAGLGTGRQVLQAAALSFDVSVQEIFYTLASGGCLVVPPPDARRDPRELIEFVIDEGIEVVDLPQSLIDAIMSLPVSFRDAPRLRHIISAGETVRVGPELAALLTERRELSLHNHYGPAENHMVASHTVSADRGNIEPLPPVGSLVWNTYIHLLDAQLQPVGDGAEGELYIGGAGVARGYTDAALTAAVFLDDPFRPGARLYRTRDRACWRPDGTLALLGRIDDMVKIRGSAVEPAEVEAALIGLPSVRAAAVFGRARRDGAVELHAVLVGDPPSALALRRELLGTLPDYMVPVRWWRVDHLPYSPNGKLDRRALPGPEATPLSLV